MTESQKLKQKQKLAGLFRQNVQAKSETHASHERCAPPSGSRKERQKQKLAGIFLQNGRKTVQRVESQSPYSGLHIAAVPVSEKDRELEQPLIEKYLGKTVWTRTEAEPAGRVVKIWRRFLVVENSRGRRSVHIPEKLYLTQQAFASAGRLQTKA